ncbi:MAG: efflux RND transporter periplasmic adaptor subunit [Pseudomonadota bacterium]
MPKTVRNVACRQWCFASLSLVVLSACTETAPPPPPPPQIEVVEVLERSTDITQDYVGQTLGSTDIPIRARVEGFLESRNFTEGRAVTKGQLLYTIDPRPYRAQVVAAEGRLAEAKTQLSKASADLERIRPLAEMKAVSQQDLDAAVSQRDAAQGALQAAEADLELANIELGYTNLYAPIDGFIGISAAEVGEFVGASPNPVVLNYVSLNDPIRVRFSINERDYLRFSRAVAEQRRQGRDPTLDPDKGSGVQLILADGSIHDHTGRIVATDAAINPETGTFTIEADFPNPDSIVIAGQFARARVVVDNRPEGLLIPQRAVSELQGGYRVFVIGDDGKVEMRPVELGPQVGRMVLVNSGVQAGERVAIEGLLSLRPGMTVQPSLTEFDSSAPAENQVQG